MFAIRQSSYYRGIYLRFTQNLFLDDELYARLFCQIALKADIKFLLVAFSAFSMNHN